MAITYLKNAILTKFQNSKTLVIHCWYGHKNQIKKYEKKEKNNTKSYIVERYLICKHNKCI